MFVWMTQDPTACLIFGVIAGIVIGAALEDLRSMF